MKRLLQALLSILFFSQLVGCVIGQSVSMSSNLEQEKAAYGLSITTLVVTDDRPYVLSGNKEPYYIGKYRSRVGIPFDVSTNGNVPLSELIRSDLDRRLAFRAPKVSNLRIVVSIKDWNFDSYQNSRLNYVIYVAVFDGKGNALESESLTDSVVVDGTLLGRGRGGIERDLPRIFDQVMQRMVADDSAIGRSMARL
jgi:hypothetical protein